MTGEDTSVCPSAVRPFTRVLVLNDHTVQSSQRSRRIPSEEPCTIALIVAAPFKSRQPWVEFPPLIWNSHVLLRSAHSVSRLISVKSMEVVYEPLGFVILGGVDVTR